MGASKHVLHLTTILCMKKCLCAFLCKTTNLWFIIICNCIYIVVIDCGWRMDLGGAWDGDWVVLTSHFTEVSKAREKSQLLYAGCVHFNVDWLFWNLYGRNIAPRPQLSWKKPGNVSFDNMGPLRCLCGNLTGCVLLHKPRRFVCWFQVIWSECHVSFWPHCWSRHRSDAVRHTSVGWSLRRSGYFESAGHHAEHEAELSPKTPVQIKTQ